MFKTWTATQAAAGAPVALLNGKEKKKRNYGTNYIENDLPNDGRSKRRHLNSTNYYSLQGLDISLDHDSSNCKLRSQNTICSQSS